MTFSAVINYLLYALSGVLFGIFASRYSVISTAIIKEKYQQQGISCLPSCCLQVLFLLVSFFIFPSWFATRTTYGAFFYYAILIYFFNKGYHTNIKKR